MYVPGHGGPQVRALINASGPRFARLADELGAPALLRPRPVLWAAFDDDGERALRAELVQRADEPDAPAVLSLRRQSPGARCCAGMCCGLRRSPRPRATLMRWLCTRFTSADYVGVAAVCVWRRR